MSYMNTKRTVIPEWSLAEMQLCQRYEGQLNPMAEPIPYVLRPLVRPHDNDHYFAADRRAETEKFLLTKADATCAPILMHFED